MSRIFKYTLIVLVLLSLYACCAKAAAQPDPVSLTEKDAGMTVDLTNSDTLVVELVGNPSTGYNWEPENKNMVTLKMVGEPEAKDAQKGVVGAPQMIELHLQAISAGTEQITLVYHRSWETNVLPLKTFTITVVVK
jgi:inhibitor of cysteine peptidase